PHLAGVVGGRAGRGSAGAGADAPRAAEPGGAADHGRAGHRGAERAGAAWPHGGADHQARHAQQRQPGRAGGPTRQVQRASRPGRKESRRADRGHARLGGPPTAGPRRRTRRATMAEEMGLIGDEPELIGDEPVAVGAAVGADAEALFAASAAAMGAPAAPAFNPSPFRPLASESAAGDGAGIDLLLDVSLEVSVELGRTRMTIGELLALRPGSVIELDKLAGEPADILVNGTRIARGEVVVVDEKFGVRVLEVVSPAKRLATMG